MLSPIFESLLNGEYYSKYERYDGVNEILTISSIDHELKITRDYMKLDAVQYSMHLFNPHHGVPIHRENIVMIDYKQFLASDADEVFGITKEDVQTVLDYYRSLG